MTAKNSLKKAIYRPAVFLCLLSIGSASASLGYQPESAMVSGSVEIIGLKTTDLSGNPHLGPSEARPEKGGYPAPARPSRPPPPSASGKVTASWYGPGHHDRLTASGQRFDMHKNTLAHKTLPLGTRVRLVNPDNGKSAEGVVNDRGPYIRGRDVDLSYAMARQLGFVKTGVMKLDLEKM